MVLTGGCDSVEPLPAVYPQDRVEAPVVGDMQCSLCHPDVSASFPASAHGLLVADNMETATGCESCHGAGGLHAMTGGNTAVILGAEAFPQACFKCHSDIGMKSQLPHAHPVLRGNVSCSECHDPHGADHLVADGWGRHAGDQSCYECHVAQTGPFAFEHEAMREGCSHCHDPHGSINEKMLTMRDANLCLQCHFASDLDTDVEIGRAFHGASGYLTQGTCWTSGCHEAVHGSHTSPNLRF